MKIIKGVLYKTNIEKVTYNRYIANDGMAFDTMSKCERYENSIEVWEDSYIILNEKYPIAFSLEKLEETKRCLKSKEATWKNYGEKDYLDYKANLVGMIRAIEKIKENSK